MQKQQYKILLIILGKEGDKRNSPVMRIEMSRESITTLIVITERQNKKKCLIVHKENKAEFPPSLKFPITLKLPPTLTLRRTGRRVGRK